MRGAKEGPADPDAAAPQFDAEATKRSPERSAASRGERFEMYKLAVEMADRVSARRTAANNFFLALHAAFASIVSLVGLPGKALVTGGTDRAQVDHLDMAFIAVVGVVLCAAWFLGLRSYRDLNTAKFKVINQLETELPVQIFSDEWRYLKQDRISGWRGRYREQGTVEQVVPVIFAIIYLVAGVSSIMR